MGLLTLGSALEGKSGRMTAHPSYDHAGGGQALEREHQALAHPERPFGLDLRAANRDVGDRYRYRLITGEQRPRIGGWHAWGTASLVPRLSGRPGPEECTVHGRTLAHGRLLPG